MLFFCALCVYGGHIAMIPVLDSQRELVEKLCATPRPVEENVLAWYEHRLGVIATIPRLMLLPMDDHLAHRGDGVFETIQYQDGILFGLDSHLARLQRSAKGIFLEPPCEWDFIREAILATVAAGKEPKGMVRVLLGRGQGGFGVDPSECPEASLYIIAYRHQDMKPDDYERGLIGARTGVPPKNADQAQIKNANYLPNVLMMHEARLRGADVPFSFTKEGYLAESAIANICLVSPDGVFQVPSLTNALKGTNLTKAIEILEGEIPYTIGLLTEDDIFAAREVMILGSGPICAPVVAYEGKIIGDGKRGPVCRMLLERMTRDYLANGVRVPGLA